MAEVQDPEVTRAIQRVTARRGLRLYVREIVRTTLWYCSIGPSNEDAVDKVMAELHDQGLI